ncbi:AAA family ATPase [Anaerovibrio sp.]|uniref:AAA family ATPase n=1 Tax=Anaerovibrio sp. TaxID=1872532 RepID=UPI001B511CE5|nr:AAA family ATPase [Anaerovibrio sp.]MBP3232182.1 AAA family ATPase [Anaerovibrio sp.]MBR2142228.1 AAA family ATPase [Anaerovibrio sp.]
MNDEQIDGAIITFFSTSSAVGKTLISINMASELAREGHSVCLADFDLQFGDVGNYLHLQPDYTITDLCDAIKNNNHQDLVNMLTTYSYDDVSFQTVLAPKRLEEAYNLEPETIIEVVKQLRRQYDYIIVDTTSMFSVLNLALLDISTIVTFLGIVDFIPTIKNMKIGNNTLNTLNYDGNKIRLVLNRSDAKTQIKLNDVTQILGENFYHILPNDFAAARQSIVTGIPLVLNDKMGTLAQALRALVIKYTNKGHDDIAENSSKSWLSKIFN